MVWKWDALCDKAHIPILQCEYQIAMIVIVWKCDTLFDIEQVPMLEFEYQMAIILCCKIKIIGLKMWCSLW